MNKNKIFTTHSFQETQQAGKVLADDLGVLNTVCLYGDLGYGKTTFIQGFAQGLGITQKIISPTFIIMRSYSVMNNPQGIKRFYHVDLYRISHEQEIIDIGLLDIMNDKENVVAIEWPEKMGKFLPEKRIDVRFDYEDENRRKIFINQ